MHRALICNRDSGPERLVAMYSAMHRQGTTTSTLIVAQGAREHLFFIWLIGVFFSFFFRGKTGGSARPQRRDLDRAKGRT